MLLLYIEYLVRYDSCNMHFDQLDIPHFRDHLAAVIMFDTRNELHQVNLALVT